GASTSGTPRRPPEWHWPGDSSRCASTGTRSDTTWARSTSPTWWSAARTSPTPCWGPSPRWRDPGPRRSVVPALRGLRGAALLAGHESAGDRQHEHVLGQGHALVAGADTVGAGHGRVPEVHGHQARGERAESRARELSGDEWREQRRPEPDLGVCDERAEGARGELVDLRDAGGGEALQTLGGLGGQIALTQPGVEDERAGDPAQDGIGQAQGDLLVWFLWCGGRLSVLGATLGALAQLGVQAQQARAVVAGHLEATHDLVDRRLLLDLLGHEPVEQLVGVDVPGLGTGPVELADRLRHALLVVQGGLEGLLGVL